MSYIGNTNTTQAFTPAIDYFSGNGSTTAFTLSRPIASVAQVQAVVNNVAQNPSSAFTVSGNTITFTSAPSSGTNNIYVYYTSPITQVVALPQNPQVFGNLQFSSSGARITGDFSNATLANRVAFQSSTTNGATVVTAIPNGNSTQSFFTVHNSSDITNSSLGYIAATGLDIRILSTSTGTGTNLPLTFFTGGSERVRVDTSGNVGIGTSSPSARLNIVDATSQDALRITQTGTGNALVVEDSPNPDSTPFVIDALGRVITGILATQGTIFGGGYNPQIQIWGIGPATASQSFASFNTANAGNGSRMWLTRSRGSFTAGVPTYGIVSNGDTLGDIQFAGDDGTVGGNFVTAAQILAQVDGTPGANDMPGRLVFSTTADGGSSPTERMRIDSSGNLLIGTGGGSVPNGTSVYGSAFDDNGANTKRLRLASSVTTTIQLVSFYNPNGNVGNITTTASATAYATSSDYRLKNTIAPMTGALAKVKALKPVTYKWNADNSDGQGFIAHELAEVVPQCVIGEKDAVDDDGNPVYQGIDTSFLVATLTAAIQELKALVDTQASTITALTARIEALENK